VIATMPELSVAILELIRQRGRMIVARAVQSMDASRKAAKNHPKVLVSAGHHERRGAGRGSSFALATG